MHDSLELLQATLLERLPHIANVTVHAEPLAERGVPLTHHHTHFFTNQVRIRMSTGNDELRLGISGLIGVIDPRITEHTGETGDDWMQAFFGRIAVMPPMFDPTGDMFQKLVVRRPHDVLMFAPFDGGLGSMVVDHNLRLGGDLEYALQWHPPIQEICRVVTEAIQEVLSSGAST